MDLPYGAVPPPERRFTGLCRPFRLTPQIQAVVCVPFATRIQLMKLIWSYIKVHKLQDSKDKRYFFPDYKLTQLFGHGRKKIVRLAKYITPFLRPMS